MRWSQFQEQLSGYQVCPRCRISFTPYESLGKMQCMQHTGVFLQGKWTCCGTLEMSSPKNPGCCPCDHGPGNGPRWRKDEVYAWIPLTWVTKLGIPETSYVFHTSDRRLVAIRRLGRQ